MDTAVDQRSVTRKRRAVLGLEALEERLNLSGDCHFTEGSGEAARAAHAINCFAGDLYQHYQQLDGNLAFSPLSISTAVGMAYAGARGETAEQIRDVFYFGEEPGIHESFGALISSLDKEDGYYEPDLANSLWPQEGVSFRQPFLDTLTNDYEGHTENLDYINEWAAARERINGWIADQTRGNLVDVIPQELINELTRLVLVNAIYMNAEWREPFEESRTINMPFTLENGETRDVPTLINDYSSFPYAEVDGFQAVSLPLALKPQDSFELPTTDSPFSMIFMLPEEGGTGELDQETLASINDSFDEPRWENVNVFLPKFEATVSSKMKRVISGMGADLMFDILKADFSGMSDLQLAAADVIHEASVGIDEIGVEASAATVIPLVTICFAKGTPIQTPIGARPIESLKVGDMVLSRDEHDPDGKVSAKQIEEVYENRTEIVELQLGDQLIRTTAEHPFYLRDRGWTSVRDLKPGDQLATDLRSWKEVANIVFTGAHETVYNFHVADYHTYFVGDDDWGFNAWVHNRCSDDVTAEFVADRPFHFMIRDNVNSAIMFIGRIEDPTQSESETVEPEVANLVQQPLIGDANSDNVVNFADFLILSANFGRETDATFAQGDFDNDAAVTFVDFLLLSQNFGQSRDVAG